MSIYKGPRLRIVRRLGELPALTSKISKKLNPPGQHGRSLMNKKGSQFSIRLKEKQKLRYNYLITERQLLNYLKKAKTKSGSSGIQLLFLLEMRLDNIIYNLNFSSTILSARQLICHKHILVNNLIVNSPSFSCKPGMIIKVKNNKVSQTLIKFNLSSPNIKSFPSHLEFNSMNLEAKVLSFVTRTSLSLIVNELLVVEFYSRNL